MRVFGRLQKQQHRPVRTVPKGELPSVVVVSTYAVGDRTDYTQSWLNRRLIAWHKSNWEYCFLCVGGALISTLRISACSTVKGHFNAESQRYAESRRENN